MTTAAGLYTLTVYTSLSLAAANPLIQNVNLAKFANVSFPLMQKGELSIIVN